MNTKHHICSCRRKGFPIAPIGAVNLNTGKNQMFGTVWECWEEGSGAFMVLQKPFEPHGQYCVFSSGTVESLQKEFAIGDTLNLCNDQTNRSIGDTWKVIGHFPYTKEGMQSAIKSLSLTPRLPFGTFK